jgi:putative toxin-antitoxin system antitoxin component (TIGR02293 family)
MEAARIVELLGGQRAIGGKVSSTADFIPLIRAGFSSRSVDKLLQHLGLKLDPVLQALRINQRTMHRRRTAESRLTREESEKIYRLARLTALAEQVFEDRTQAQIWLTSAIPGLGGVTPLSLLDTDEGARQSENELLRLAWGVYS